MKILDPTALSTAIRKLIAEKQTISDVDLAACYMRLQKDADARLAESRLGKLRRQLAVRETNDLQDETIGTRGYLRTSVYLREQIAQAELSANKRLTDTERADVEAEIRRINARRTGIDYQVEALRAERDAALQAEAAHDAARW